MARRFRISPSRRFLGLVAACSGCSGCNGCSCSCYAMTVGCVSCSADALARHWISRIESIDIEKVKDKALRAKIEAVLEARSAVNV